MRFRHPDGTTIHLSYCSNVHPAEDVDGIVAQLPRFAGPVRRAVGSGRLGLGMWLPARAARELAGDPAAVKRLREALDAQRLEVVTLNGFPFGGFHDPVVKKAVYQPDWTDPARLSYTLDLAQVLAELLPDDVREGSISTVPLGWHDGWDERSTRAALRALRRLADELEALHERTGRMIRIGLEPEPGCIVETTSQAAELLARGRIESSPDAPDGGLHATRPRFDTPGRPPTGGARSGAGGGGPHGPHGPHGGRPDLPAASSAEWSSGPAGPAAPGGRDPGGRAPGASSPPWWSLPASQALPRNGYDGAAPARRDATGRSGTGVTAGWVGVCLDACHLAVQFEDPDQAVVTLAGAGVPIVKAQVSTALRVADPPDAVTRAVLGTYIEPRFLHQTRERLTDGRVVGVDDLDEALGGGLPGQGEWRVHFHVPVHWAGPEPEEGVTGPDTTQPELWRTIGVLVGGPHPLTTHLDVETYTWTVLPRDQRPEGDAGLIDGLARELLWTRYRLTELGLQEIP